MDPITLTAISLGATALGGATSAIGGIMSGNANAAAFKYQAGIAQMNTQIAKQNADYSRSVGEVEAQQSGMKTRFQEGAIKVAQGASGLDVNKGSAVAVQDSQHQIGLEDQAIIRSNAAKKAYGFEVEAAQETAKGQLALMSGDSAKTAGYISAAGSLLGTAGSVAGKWLTAKQTGQLGGDAGGGGTNFDGSGGWG